MRFADAASRARLGGAGTLVLRIEKLGPRARGRLSEVIDDAMERELAARGATSPGIGSSEDPDAALSDQLFRARQVGVYRVCVALGPLGAASSPMANAGALDPIDARTLLFLARATSERPVELVLDTSDEQAGVFLTAVPLKDALAGKHLDSPTPEATPIASSVEPTPVAPPVEATPTPTFVTSAVSPRRPDAAIEKHTAGVSTTLDDPRWRHWTLALHAAKGPQSLASFEKLFRESYVPLCEAVDHGLSDTRAAQARDEFRAAFTRMYTEACLAFAVTGKRPKMVFDAPEIAARMARSHGARKVQLLLAASMRYDMGRCVRDALAARPRSPVVEDVILWSALPTTTSRQLDCLTRGVEALRGPPASEREPDALRGRTVDTIRRVKIGSRDVFKLDSCEVRIADAASHAGDASRAMPRIAETPADAIAKHVDTLAPRTLLFVFGDHGFTIDGSGLAASGGATPEEVLVPAFAVLVGDDAKVVEER